MIDAAQFVFPVRLGAPDRLREAATTKGKKLSSQIRRIARVRAAAAKTQP